jgi:tetratricopeptide (TPR) repeat protein
LGQTQEASGDIEKAIPAMHRAVQLDSKNEAYRFRYGMMLTDTKAPGAAVIRLQEALKEFPDSPRLWFALGFAQYQYTKYQDAAKSFQRALQLQPTMAASLAYLGIVNVALDNVPQAIEYYQRALQIEDHLAVLDYLTAEAYLKLSPPNDAQAEAHLKRALKLDPKLSQARVDLGKLYFGSGRLPEAAAELESAAQADPSMAEVYYQLGRVYKRMKRIDDAKLMFAKFEKLRTQEKRQSEDQTQEVVRRLADVRF